MRAVIKRNNITREDFPLFEHPQLLSTFCKHCGMETRLSIEAVDGGEAEMWRTKYNHIVDTLDAISKEVDTWFDVNPWREQAKVVRARLDALLRSIGRLPP
jgi:hypothetical protein